MKQEVKVLRCHEDATADVIHIRQSACSGDCHKCSGCGAAQESLRLVAQNPIGAQPGDMVVIESQTGPVLAAAAVLYLLPLVLFFLGYLMGNILWSQGALTGCLCFAVGIAGSVMYDRLVAKKKVPVYTITGFVRSDVQEF
jgi:sigma-E factor negative regulatory protein RseC